MGGQGLVKDVYKVAIMPTLSSLFRHVEVLAVDRDRSIKSNR